MASPNVSPAAFGVPAGPSTHRYAKAIVAMYNDLQDCWPCDDAASATSLRNLISGGNALDTFVSNSVYPGRPSLLGGDPLGKSVRVETGAAYHAAAYTMPSVGTLEMLIGGGQGLGQSNDASIFGNWNGNGIAWLKATAGATTRIYKDGTNVSYTPVAAEMTPTQHWALSWDGTTERWYINGIQRLTQAVGSPAAGGWMGLGVYSSGIHAISGMYQWLCVYKRALAAGEIAAHAALVTQPS